MNIKHAIQQTRKRTLKSHQSQTSNKNKTESLALNNVFVVIQSFIQAMLLSQFFILLQSPIKQNHNNNTNNMHEKFNTIPSIIALLP